MQFSEHGLCLYRGFAKFMENGDSGAKTFSTPCLGFFSINFFPPQEHVGRQHPVGSARDGALCTLGGDGGSGAQSCPTVEDSAPALLAIWAVNLGTKDLQRDGRRLNPLVQSPDVMAGLD